MDMGKRTINKVLEIDCDTERVGSELKIMQRQGGFITEGRRGVDGGWDQGDQICMLVNALGVVVRDVEGNGTVPVGKGIEMVMRMLEAVYVDPGVDISIVNENDKKEGGVNYGSN